jgi:hypothetical protein
MGNDARGHKGSRSGQRDGSSGDVTPRQAPPITEKEANRIAHLFLDKPRTGVSEYYAFTGVWTRLTEEQREQVAFAIHTMLKERVMKLDAAETWEELRILQVPWLNRSWGHANDSFAQFLGWLSDQQAKLVAESGELRADLARLADLDTCNDAPPGIPVAA